MEQSKLESRIEVTANIGSGMILSYFVWNLIVVAIEHGLLKLDDSFIIVSIFTIVSVIRSYYWRRFFAREFQNSTWIFKR